MKADKAEYQRLLDRLDKAQDETDRNLVEALLSRMEEVWARLTEDERSYFDDYYRRVITRVVSRR